MEDLDLFFPLFFLGENVWAPYFPASTWTWTSLSHVLARILPSIHVSFDASAYENLI